MTHLEETSSGLQHIVTATADVYAQGAHIVRWQPDGHRPVLFLSSRSFFEAGKPIRGGIPIVFPWFGARPEGAHGYARTSVWQAEEAIGEAVTWKLERNPFALTLEGMFGDTLSVYLTIRNKDSRPQTVEMALHSYFAVGDAERIAISGLDGTEYLDKMDNFSRKMQAGDVVISGPTDRVYLNTAAPCVIRDPVWNRHIVVEKEGSSSTVVWNPFARLADMAEDEWRGMVCVETANVGNNSVTIAPGATHAICARISVHHGA